MAKTFKHLFPHVVEFENLWLAYTKARRGKRNAPPAARFDANAGENLLELKEELVEGRYRPGAYHHFYIHEPKQRLISAAPFRDRVVHHAVVNVLEPLYEARFSGSSYACRKGKGSHAAMERAHWGVRNCRWMLKGDIRKFFPSVDHEVLKSVLFRKIADRELRALCSGIIDSDADRLREGRASIARRLEEMRLRVHPRKTEVRPCAQGVKFLGFRLTPTTRRVARESISRFRNRMRRHRRAKRGRTCDLARVTASVRGWIAHCDHANSETMLKEVLSDVTV